MEFVVPHHSNYSSHSLKPKNVGNSKIESIAPPQQLHEQIAIILGRHWIVKGDQDLPCSAIARVHH